MILGEQMRLVSKLKANGVISIEPLILKGNIPIEIKSQLKVSLKKHLDPVIIKCPELSLLINTIHMKS